MRSPALAGQPVCPAEIRFARPDLDSDLEAGQSTSTSTAPGRKSLRPPGIVGAYQVVIRASLGATHRRRRAKRSSYRDYDSHPSSAKCFFPSSLVGGDGGSRWNWGTAIDSVALYGGFGHETR